MRRVDVREHELPCVCKRVTTHRDIELLDVDVTEDPHTTDRFGAAFLRSRVAEPYSVQCRVKEATFQIRQRRIDARIGEREVHSDWRDVAPVVVTVRLNIVLVRAMPAPIHRCRKGADLGRTIVLNAIRLLPRCCNGKTHGCVEHQGCSVTRGSRVPA